MIKIILTFIFLPLMVCNNVISYNDINLFDDSHFYPEAGLYLEPAGQYLSYSGTIIIPFTYVLPSLNFIKASYCPGHSRLEYVHHNVLEHIKMVTIQTTRTINKRSLYPIATVLSGGLSIWNTVEIQSIKAKINALYDNSLKINSVVNNITNSQNIIIDRLGEMMIIVGDHARAINNLINYTQCIERDNDEFQLYVTNWLYSAPSEFISAYSSSITGKLSPSLLSASNLYQILLLHNDMKNTIYTTEPSTVYEFGQVLLQEVIVDDHAHLKGIIQLPKILALSPLPMYNVYTVNILHKNIDNLVVLPGLFVCPRQEECWEADNTRCIKKSNRLICLHGINNTPNLCYHNIKNNKNLNNCTIQFKIHKDPIVVQTKSGILIGGSLINYKVFRKHLGIDIPSFTINARQIPIMITSKHGDWVTISDNIYSTIVSGFDYNFTTYMNNISLNYYIDKINTLKIDYKWKNLDKLKFDNLRFDNIEKYDGLYIILILSIIILFIMVCFLLYKQVINNRNKRQPRAHLEFLGLR